MQINEIIQGCIRCEAACQRKLFDMYAPTLMTVCRRYASPPATPSADLLQEAFIKIFHSIRQFDASRGSFEGWMKRIVINLAITEWRKEHKMQWSVTDIEAVQLPDMTRADQHLHEEDLLAIIDKLPAGYKVVFNLYAVEGYSHQEIAKELGITESTSRSQLTHARKFLRNLLLDNQPQNTLVYE